MKLDEIINFSDELKSGSFDNFDMQYIILKISEHQQFIAKIIKEHMSEYSIKNPYKGE